MSIKKVNTVHHFLAILIRNAKNISINVTKSKHDRHIQLTKCRLLQTAISIQKRFDAHSVTYTTQLRSKIKLGRNMRLLCLATKCLQTSMVSISMSWFMFRRARPVNLSSVMEFRKKVFVRLRHEKDLSASQDVTGNVHPILIRVLMLGNSSFSACLRQSLRLTSVDSLLSFRILQ